MTDEELPVLTFDCDAGPDTAPVDLNTLVTSRLLIQANSGGGKSRALRYLLEQTFGQVQHFVFDPEGEYATLRERFAYVLAGPGADVSPMVRKLMRLGINAASDFDRSGMPKHYKVVQVSGVPWLKKRVSSPGEKPVSELRSERLSRILGSSE